METGYQTRTKLYAGAGMLLTTMIWGCAFVVMKNSLDRIPPTWLLALRFLLAAAALAIFFRGRLRTAVRADLANGAILGLFLGAAYLFQTYGLKYTTASKNAFITTLYVVIVPFLHWGINHKKPGPGNAAAAVLAVVGLALLSLQGDLTVNFGDLLTLAAGIAFALHMVFIDRFTEKQDPILLTVVQIAAAGLMNLALAPLLDGGLDIAVLAAPSMAAALAYLAFLSTMLGFLLQNVGQKFLSANTSSILLSMESVFGAAASVIFLKEVLTGRMLVGCALMFAAVLLSELGPRK